MNVPYMYSTVEDAKSQSFGTCKTAYRRVSKTAENETFNFLLNGESYGFFGYSINVFFMG
jgi:hypothetical protein